MTAQEELEKLKAKIESGDMPLNEPVFVLRGRDVLASGAVTGWAACARVLGAPIERVNDAMDLADSMRKWKPKRIPGRPEGWKKGDK